MFTRWRWFTHYSERRLEYITGVYTAVVGAWILLPTPAMRGNPALEYAATYIGENRWGMVFFGLGLANLYALHINGSAWWTPFVRLVCSALSMMAFTVMAGTFIARVPSSLGTCISLCSAFLFCGNCALSAARDAGREYRQWSGSKGDD